MWLKKSTGLQRQRRLHSAVQAHSVSILISSAPQIAEIFTLAPGTIHTRRCCDRANPPSVRAPYTGILTANRNFDLELANQDTSAQVIAGLRVSTGWCRQRNVFRGQYSLTSRTQKLGRPVHNE